MLLQMKLVALGVLEGHKRYVTSCAFSDDGALVAAGSGDRMVHVWRVDRAASSVSRNTSTANKKPLAKFPSQRFRENLKVGLEFES